MLERKIEKHLHEWKNDPDRKCLLPGRIEVDFFIRQNNDAVAVEVKSSENTKSKSMKAILTNYGVKRGIKLSTKNVSRFDKYDNLPLYMAIYL